MKNFLIYITLILLSISLVSCDNVDKGDYLNVNKPVFLKIEDAKQELQGAVFGSHGWSIVYPVESYIDARFGSYWLRYDINTNKIDRALKFEDGFWDTITNLSKSGNYAIKSTLYDEENEPANIFFIDFKNEEVVFLAYAVEEFKIEDIPEDIRSEFELENIFTSNINEPYFERVEYDIQYIFESSSFIVYEGEEILHELTVLEDQGILMNNFVWIDEKTIGVLMPIENGFDLGYYKFALIDIIEDRIIQECPINRR
ncbi:hypothetical protein EDC19_0861 [Natranaerovirga hydrolytica]|uniref:Uncharacterized protein n=1 Tax=Natranaerovirga hydrolytica TaxID=680378 RepID=A0A4V2Q1P9_9FIRM|nr:hypothetical protein [Natranaerovirga hydrolytica]TCK98441.1 hypothetical protein EDC19_0861 [Natranaerovirga hydrolytica]